MNRTQEKKVRMGMAPGRCLYNRQDGDGGPRWFMKGGGDLCSTEGERCEFVLASLKEVRAPGFVQTGGERSRTDVGLGEWLNQNIIHVAKPCPGHLLMQEKIGLLVRQLNSVDWSDCLTIHELSPNF